MLIWVNVIVSICLVKKHDGQTPSSKKHAPWKHSLTCFTVGTFKLCFSLDYHILMVFLSPRLIILSFNSYFNDKNLHLLFSKQSTGTVKWYILFFLDLNLSSYTRTHARDCHNKEGRQALWHPVYLVPNAQWNPFSNYLTAKPRAPIKKCAMCLLWTRCVQSAGGRYWAG